MKAFTGFRLMCVGVGGGGSKEAGQESQSGHAVLVEEGLL